VGLFDVILGRRKLEKAKPDQLFALTTAYVTMATELEVLTCGSAAVVFQPLQTGDFTQIVREAEEIVKGVGSESGTQVDSTDDRYGYRWVVVRDPDFDDLVVALNALSGSLEEGGYGERILCAVFAFQDAQGRPLYLIYNYKRGTFHPFVPAAGGGEARDNEYELRLKAQLGSELPIEPELERWLALWGIPI